MTTTPDSNPDFVPTHRLTATRGYRGLSTGMPLQLIKHRAGSRVGTFATTIGDTQGRAIYMHDVELLPADESQSEDHVVSWDRSEFAPTHRLVSNGILLECVSTGLYRTADNATRYVLDSDVEAIPQLEDHVVTRDRVTFTPTHRTCWPHPALATSTLLEAQGSRTYATASGLAYDLPDDYVEAIRIVLDESTEVADTDARTMPPVGVQIDSHAVVTGQDDLTVALLIHSLQQLPIPWNQEIELHTQQLGRSWTVKATWTTRNSAREEAGA